MRINTICACQGRCAVLFLTENISSYRCAGVTFVWCRLLFGCCLFDRLHYKASITRSEASFLKYLGSVRQNFRSEIMFQDRFTCSITSQVVKVISTVKNGVGGGWIVSNFVDLHRYRCDREYERCSL